MSHTIRYDTIEEFNVDGYRVTGSTILAGSDHISVLQTRCLSLFISTWVCCFLGKKLENTPFWNLRDFV